MCKEWQVEHTDATSFIFSPGANIPSPADLTSISDEVVFQSGGVGFLVASHAMIAARAPGSFTPGKTTEQTPMVTPKKHPVFLRPIDLDAV